MADEATIRKVQASWDRINEIGREKVGVILFQNIFKAAPAALKLFSFKDEKDLTQSKSFKRHCRVVVSTVGLAVAGLRDLDKLVPVLKSLGKFHGDMGKGIGAAQYDLVGAQLIVTLRTVLGSEFTPDVEKSWTDIYSVVSATMQSGIPEVAPADPWAGVKDVVTNENQDFTVQGMEKIYGRNNSSGSVGRNVTAVAIAVAVIGVLVALSFTVGRH